MAHSYAFEIPHEFRRFVEHASRGKRAGSTEWSVHFLSVLDTIVRRVLRCQTGESSMEHWILTEARSIEPAPPMQRGWDCEALASEVSQRLCRQIVQRWRQVGTGRCRSQGETLRPAQTVLAGP